jgi:cyclic beta-1,2-glucan synthetase
MKASPARIVLAFYSSEEGHADNAFRALKRTEKVCLAGPDPSTLTVDCKRFYGLKIEGETLLVVTTESSRIEDVVKTLRLEGSPAIFAVRPDFGLRDYQTDKETEGQPEEFGAQSRAEILDRLKRNQKDLEAARCDLLEATRLDHALTPAAEWLLDNAYLIRTQILEVRRHLPKDYKSAPHSLEPGKQAGNVNDLAHTLAASTDRALTENNIRDSLRDYQASTPLTIAELWAFPLFLRIALIETLTKIATRVSHAQELRESAYLWANRLANSSRVGAEAFAGTLKNLENEPVARHPYFVTALAEQLQDEESALGPAQHWIEAKFNQSLIDVVRTQHNNEAAQVVSTANAFTSLRSLSRLDFTKIFEEVSLVEIELRRDPAGIYGRSDFPTRDLCRNAVERTSRFSGAPEREVAARAVALAAAEHDKPGSGADLRKPDIQKSDIRKNSVTWFLLSDGITQLEYALGARVPARVKTRRLIYRHPTFFYITALTVLTVCLNALTAVLARDAGVHGFAFLSALIVLSLFPLSELSVQIVNALVISLLPPDLLPKMNFKEGIPPENATLVVVPMMLSSLETIHAELEKLEVRFLANRNENLFYSLFSDFLDAPEQTTPEDAGLLRAIKAGIEELNARYAENHFLLFHRPRTWSENEEHWIGRERKRGKLEELNAFLCGAGHPGILQAGRLPLPIAFVITLDADTQLPVESARCLIETIAHPLNRGWASLFPAPPPRGSPAFSRTPPEPIPIRKLSRTRNRISSSKPSSTAKRFTMSELSTPSSVDCFRPIPFSATI